MDHSFIEQFNKARRAGAPLVAVRTPDIEATIKTIALNKDNASAPMVLYDCVRGLTPVNGTDGQGARTLGVALVKQLAPTIEAQKALANPTEMLVEAGKIQRESILFMANLHRFFNDPQVVQGIWNLRNQFKANSRTLVILCPDVTLPPEIAQDVLVLDEPLPNTLQLEGIVNETYKAVKLAPPESEVLSRSVDALCGLAAFPAEQVCAMSIRKSGMDIEQLWERKRQQIEQTPGLTVWRGPERFSNIGGCGNIKEFFTSIRNGEERPRAIIFQDELEKQYGGAAGDLSGVTQEILGMQLSFMQDHDSSGIMEIGHAGVAKSAIAKALGNEAGIPVIQLDLGQAKGSLVGESNQNMRTILKVIEAVSQGRALWVATSNDISKLAPELKSRYTFGTFFFDLPTPSERSLIWNIYFDKYGIADRDKPLDTGWTGREIRNCCLLAYRLKIPLKKAATYISPIFVSDKEKIVNLRREANGRYISAAVPGLYTAPADLDTDDTETDQKMLVAFAVMDAPKRNIKADDALTKTPPKGGKPN